MTKGKEINTFKQLTLSILIHFSLLEHCGWNGYEPTMNPIVEKNSIKVIKDNIRATIILADSLPFSADTLIILKDRYYTLFDRCLRNKLKHVENTNNLFIETWEELRELEELRTFWDNKIEPNIFTQIGLY